MISKSTMELLVLNLLEEEDMYGYQLTSEIKKRSDKQFAMAESTLYPILYKMIELGYVTDNVKIVDKRLRKYYHIETAGKEHLNELRTEYETLVTAINKIITS